MRLAVSAENIPGTVPAAPALGEMARVVRPNGYVLVSADNRWRLTDVLDPWRSPPLDAIKGAAGGVLRQLGLRRPPACREPSPQAVSNAELDRWLVSVGLRKVRSTTLGFAHFTFFGRNLSARLASEGWKTRRLHRELLESRPAELVGDALEAMGRTRPAA